MKNTIKVERARLNMSQDELAQNVNLCRQMINKIEARKITPSVLIALRIASFFKTTVDNLFQLETSDLKIIRSKSRHYATKNNARKKDK